MSIDTHQRIEQRTPVRAGSVDPALARQPDAIGLDVV